MKKIKTLFEKDPADLGRVIPSEPLYPLEELTFRIKIDGTACYILDSQPYVRYDAKLSKKKGKRVITISREEVAPSLPAGAIPCQEPDVLSGHWPHWVPLLNQPAYGKQKEGFENSCSHLSDDGSYECFGPGVQNNPQQEEKLLWVKHDSDSLIVPVNLQSADTYKEMQTFLANFPYEGLVAYRDGDPVAKIRRSDFGFPAIPYNKISSRVQAMKDEAGRIAHVIASKRMREYQDIREYKVLMAEYPIRPIRNEEEYAAAQKVVNVFSSFNTSDLTEDEKDYRLLLLRVIEYYEEHMAHLQKWKGESIVDD